MKYKPVSISAIESYLLISSVGLNNDQPKLSQLLNMLVYCLFLSYATCPLFLYVPQAVPSLYGPRGNITLLLLSITTSNYYLKLNTLLLLLLLLGSY